MTQVFIPQLWSSAIVKSLSSNDSLLRTIFWVDRVPKDEFDMKEFNFVRFQACIFT